MTNIPIQKKVPVQPRKHADYPCQIWQYDKALVKHHRDKILQTGLKFLVPSAAPSATARFKFSIDSGRVLLYHRYNLEREDNYI